MLRISKMVKALTQLRDYVSRSRGSIITVKPTKMFDDVDMVNVVKNLMMALSKIGLVTIVRKRRTMVYMFERGSPAYRLIVEGDINCLLNLAYYQKLFDRRLSSEELDILVEKCMD